MFKNGKEITVYEQDLKWWYFWLHPVDAMIFSHYGCMCFYEDIPDSMKKALIKKE